MTDLRRATPGGADLLERDAELRALEDALAAGRHGAGRLVLVEGHAGIGKSRLLDETVARAREQGITVLRARASELESDFAFGIARQLFEPLLAGADDERRDRLLEGSAALAAPLLGRPAPGAPDDDPEDRSYPVVHGLFWLLSNLARAEPVLVVVDDAHWADRPSLRLALYVLQRLDEMAVTVVVARRLGEPGAPDDLLAQLAAHAGTRGVRPAPLSQAAARILVDAVLAGADRQFADACWRMTEGNPFLLGELVRAVAAERWQPTARNAGRIGSLAPEAVLRAVAVRLMRLSDDAASVARAVAVLGDDAHPRHVAALTGRGSETVGAATDALAAGEILRPAGSGTLTFAHPLLASAVYADIGGAERAALHHRAARILCDQDVAPERVAAHLLASPGGGEPWVVDVLCASARRAMALGAPESAASYLRRALDEPPDAAQRSSVLRRLGLSDAANGLPTAVGRLEEALAAADDPCDRARALLALGRTLSTAGRAGEAVSAFERAAGEVRDEDPRLAGEAEAEALTLGLLDPDRRPEFVDRLGTVLESGAPGFVRDDLALVTISVREGIVGRSREDLLALVRRVAGNGGLQPGEATDGNALYALAAVLSVSDELDWADRVLTAAIAEAQGRGSVMGVATASCWRAVPRWAQARLAEALADVERALDAERYGWRQFLPMAYGLVVGLHLELGEAETAAARAAQIDPADHAPSSMLAPLYEARGRLALVQRRDADALAEFEAWRDVMAGVLNPAFFAGWRSSSARALVRLDRAGEARALAAEELELVRGFAAPRPISVALRALAHVEADADIDRAIELLHEAVAAVDGSEAQLEHCRALFELGIALRRAGRRSEAGRALGASLEISRACGARLLEQRATRELEVAGARVQRAARRGADALSPSERRVVTLAVEGLSNREIAEALFVTRKAVEWHLGNAYRKLDVRSRRDLAAALANGAPPPPPST